MSTARQRRSSPGEQFRCLPDRSRCCGHTGLARPLKCGLGSGWTDSGLAFTSSVGTVIEPRNLNRLFDGLIARADVRRIRFHDLRHTCASLLLARNCAAPGGHGRARPFPPCGPGVRLRHGFQTDQVVTTSAGDRTDFHPGTACRGRLGTETANLFRVRAGRPNCPDWPPVRLWPAGPAWRFSARRLLHGRRPNSCLQERLGGILLVICVSGCSTGKRRRFWWDAAKDREDSAVGALVPTDLQYTEERGSLLMTTAPCRCRDGRCVLP